MFAYIKKSINKLFSRVESAGCDYDDIVVSEEPCSTHGFYSPHYLVNTIMSDSEVVDKILGLQFAEGGKKHIALNLALLFDKQCIELKANELKFFNELVNSIYNTDRYPITNVSVLKEKLHTIYELTYSGYVDTLFTSVIEAEEVTPQTTVSSNVGSNLSDFGERFNYDMNKQKIEEEKINALADSLGLKDDEMSIDELLANTAMALK